ncbi:MAG: AMP-binding protein [Desulfobacterales bacterium]
MSSPLETNLIRRIALGDMVRRRAQSHENQEALVEYKAGNRLALTYSGLNSRLNRFVAAMRAAGIRQGDRVAVIGPNSIDYMTALLGIFKGGFVAVPMNYHQSREDIHYTIDHSGARAILADYSLFPRMEEMACSAGDDFVLVGFNDAGDKKTSAFSSLDAFLNGHPDDEIEDIIIEDDDSAQIMYTSGTTARPKGVVASHKNLFITSLNSALSIGIGQESADTGIVLPLFHITAELAALLSLHLGGKLVLVAEFQPDDILHLIESERINTMALLPLMWKALAASPNIGRYDYSSLKRCMYGMAPMDAVTLKSLGRTFGCTFSLCSGQTEIAGVATRLAPVWGEVKEGNYWGDGSVTCDQAIMDEEGRILSRGKVGEIVWRSPQVMLGYYKDEQSTAASRAHGWHHSGDIGFIDEDNQLRFIDRNKDIVKTGGENVSSIKIEESILELEGIANAGVVGLPHSHWGEAVTAFVSLTPGLRLTEQMILEHCKKKLGRFEVPKKVLFLDQFPVTATGKVKKHMLKQAYANVYGV